MGTSFIFNSLVPRLSSSLASQPVFLQEEGKVIFPPRKQRLARETSSHPAFRRLHYEKRIDEKLDESLGTRLDPAHDSTLPVPRAHKLFEADANDIIS